MVEDAPLYVRDPAGGVPGPDARVGAGAPGCRRDRAGQGCVVRVVRRVGRRLREEAIWLILVAGVLMAASGTGQLLDAIWQSLGGR